MNTILLLGLNTIISLFVSNNFTSDGEIFPQMQVADQQAFAKSSDYFYSYTGELIEYSFNNQADDRFFVNTQNNSVIEIQLTNSTKKTHGREIGYLARILSAEALVSVKNGYAQNISMYSRICIAESIKNRKNSDFGFYKNYTSYRSVITYTGYATNAREFIYTRSWLNNQVAKKRFVQEVLPAAIFVYFNDSDYTNGATGFITPAKMSNTMYQNFAKRTLIEIKGIDPYYEFTFWKY